MKTDIHIHSTDVAVCVWMGQSNNLTTRVNMFLLETHEMELAHADLSL